MFGHEEHDICEADFDNYKELGAFLGEAKSHGTAIKPPKSHGILKISA